MSRFLLVILPYFQILTSRKLLLQYLTAIYQKYEIEHISERYRLTQTELNERKRLYFREGLKTSLQLDSKLSFNVHTNSKISKATKDIKLLRKLQRILPRRSLLIIYKSSIRPDLDYGDVIYDQPSNTSFSNKTESVQYNAAQAIAGAIKGSSRHNLYQELGLEYLQQRR